MKQLIFIFFSLLLIQCGKTEIDQPDYFIFGRYENICQKDCSNFVKYESNNLYRDNVIILSDELTFNTTTLPLDNLTEVKSLRDNITTYMENNVGNIGCPNCDGTGAYYIEIRKSGTVKKWRLDDDKSKITDNTTKLYLDMLVSVCNKFAL